MNITVVTEPPFEPVALSDVYLHLRLDTEGSPETHPDDSRLERHITSARKLVEAMSRRALIRQTLRLSMPAFPVSDDTWAISSRRNTLTRVIRLPRPPISSVTSVTYYDADNTLQTLDASNYYITDEQVPELRFTSTFSSPTVYDRPDAVRVNYIAGYTPAGSPPTTQQDYAAEVPDGLKDAILLGVQLLYDDLKPDEYTMLFNAREALVQPYRIQLLP
jgi:uncharacterized phiE125 gp8 family phage protein